MSLTVSGFRALRVPRRVLPRLHLRSLSPNLGWRGVLSQHERTYKTYAEVFEVGLKKRAWDTFEFFGITIKTHADGSFSINKEAYTNKLKLIPTDASFARVMSYRSGLAWIGYKLIDVLCAYKKAAQVRKKISRRKTEFVQFHS